MHENLFDLGTKIIDLAPWRVLVMDEGEEGTCICRKSFEVQE